MNIYILVGKLIRRRGVFFIRNLLATITTGFGIVNAERR